MAKLDDVLKKLNRTRADKDKIQVEPEEGSLTTDFSSTGSVYLDLVLNKTPIPLGLMTLLTGWEGSGKS